MSCLEPKNVPTQKTYSNARYLFHKPLGGKYFNVNMYESATLTKTNDTGYIVKQFLF